MTGLNPGQLAESASRPGLPRLVLALLILIFATSSFDVFLNLRLGGFSLRFCYLLILLFAFVYAPKLHLLALRPPSVPGWPALLLWTAFLLVFIPNTHYLPRNIGYMAWHLIHLLFLFLFVEVINQTVTLRFLFKAYVLTYVGVAAFGLIQFAAGLAGIGILVTQWWIDGRLPRINGFSYEPSYYGSYLIIGWIILFTLFRMDNGLFTRRQVKWMLALTTASLLLSSSRMSIVVASVFVCAGLATALFRLAITLRIARAWIAIALIFFVGSISATVTVASHWNQYKFLFQGLGVGGTASHSTVQRYERLWETVDVFWRSPFIGVSLGGIPSAIADARHILISSNEDAKSFEGSNIFAEVLSASGIIAFPFFCVWLAITLAMPLRLLRARWGALFPDQRPILASLLLGLIFELIILSMNQNILRAFLWIHIALLAVACKLARRAMRDGDENAMERAA